MASVLIAALLAAAPPQAPANAPAPGPALDRACFALMAELADGDDPRMRPIGRIAAQYFLGRIDSADPAFDAEAPLPASANRGDLLRRCGDAMQAGGRDFRSIGEALAPAARPTA
jgi:hypothetical protein